MSQYCECLIKITDAFIESENHKEIMRWTDFCGWLVYKKVLEMAWPLFSKYLSCPTKYTLSETSSFTALGNDKARPTGDRHL